MLRLGVWLPKIGAFGIGQNTQIYFGIGRKGGKHAPNVLLIRMLAQMAFQLFACKNGWVGKSIVVIAFNVVYQPKISIIPCILV